MCFVAGLVLAVWFGALEYRELFHPDEGRYALIPYEMVTSGDWVTPRLNGLKYFEKPPLQYWLTAVSYLVLGADEWTARLWPALAGLLTVGLVFWAGRRLSGVRAGATAAALLASTFQFFLFSQILTLDMGLTFFLTLALVAFLASQDADSRPATRRGWALVMWAAMALAVLSKGLVGVVLPALVLSVYLLLERDWGLLRRLSWGAGVPLFLGIVLPWFVLVQVRNPGFSEFFFVREHLARYAMQGHDRNGPWYYFLIVLVAGSLPWSLTYLKALLAGWRSDTCNRLALNPCRLLTLWVVVITVFFSLSASKLPGYVLPVFPAVALLAGCQLESGKVRIRRANLAGIAAAGLTLAVAAPFLSRLPGVPVEGIHSSTLIPWILASGLVLAAGAGLATLAIHRRREVALFAVTLGSLLSFQLLLVGSQSIAGRYSTEAIVEQAQEAQGGFDPDAPFFSVGLYDQTLPLHIGRPVTLVCYEDELAMGIAEEPSRAISSIEEFRSRWHALAQAYAILKPDRFLAETHAATPMVVLAASPKAVIVARSQVESSRRLPTKATL